MILQTKPERIPAADYVAFGHIHKPQSILGIDHGRYAGSPIQIDFGEVVDQKSCFLVTGKPGYALDIQPRTLDVGRRLIDIVGSLAEISANREQYRDTIARVFVKLDSPTSDLESQVREMLTNTVVAQVKGQFDSVPDDLLAITSASTDREPTLNEMFATYLTERPQTGDPARVQRYFDDLLHRVEGGDLESQSFADVDEALS